MASGTEWCLLGHGIASRTDDCEKHFSRVMENAEVMCDGVVPGAQKTGRTAESVCFLTEVWFMDTKSICPTVDEINVLPSKVKRYIHDLEMRINQNGQTRRVMQLREERDLLRQRVEELEARIALQEREYLEAPIETD